MCAVMCGCWCCVLSSNWWLVRSSERVGSRIVNLNHVTLIVNDFEKSLAFYKRLGFLQIVHAPPRYARFQCPDGDATLSIEVTGEDTAPPRTQLYFECEDLDDRVARLEADGIVFTQPPTDMSYLWREARLVDPDGHDLRLFDSAGNRLDPPWRIPTPE